MRRGKYIRTEEIKKKTSQSLRNKYPSNETKRKMSIAQSGKNNPMYGKPSPNKGKHFSLETKQKMSVARKGKQVGENHPMYGKHHSKETKQKISIAVRGENNPSWKNGISFLPYCQKFTRHLKESIRKRDNYTCQLCGKIQDAVKEKLSIHHVHYDRENCYPDLISLCRSCNSKVNFNRDYWEDFFMSKLKVNEIC